MRTRGSGYNPHNRFHRQIRVTDVTEPTPDSLATEVREERSRSIVSFNQSPDVPFDRSINPYRGCEHGCIYCFARPTHAYWDLSPGLDFESRLTVKINAPQQLRQTLDNPRYQCQPLALGVNTDAYQPLEKRYGLTRQILEVLLEYRHPLALITRGSLVLRDLDLLSELAREQLCAVRISLSTLDPNLKRIMEPRASNPGTRLRMIRELSGVGIPTGIILGPVIPFINDHEIEAMLEAAQEAGATRASWILLRLPHEVGPLFEDWLHRHFPDRAEHVLNRIRDMRGGSLYDARYGHRMRGAGPYADLVRQRFRRKARALGLDQTGDEPLRTDRFRRPGGEQLGLL